MACKNDQTWEDWGDKGEENPTLSLGWNGNNIVWKQECVYWSHLLQLRNLYNQVRDECLKYGIELMLPTGRPKYGEPGHREEIEPLATINGFFSIKMTGGQSPQFDETRFIITGGTINDRIPAPNPDYEYAANDYGPWIVYLKSECYGCGGWELERSGDHYPRYRCCYGNYCADMDPLEWKSQNYVGRTTEGGICNLGREWGDNYMDMVEHCMALSPRFQCVCDDYPPCDDYRNECCQQDVMWHFSNFYDVLGPSGATYGDPNCNVDALQCPTIYEKRGIKWIGSHEPSSGYQGYVTQVIKAKHLSDIWTAIQPALTGQHRVGRDWYYCKDRNDKKWNKDASVNWETFRYRFEQCQKCDAPPAESEPICACEMNDLAYVLNKMLNNTCICVGTSKEFAGKDMWKIVASGTPTKEECSCPCVFDVWSFSVYHSVFGYAEFHCGPPIVDDNPDDDFGFEEPVFVGNRYLTYTISCAAGSSGGQCTGDVESIGSINIVTKVDEYTGLSCTTGLPTNGYSCSGGSDCNETCSETQKTYNCTARPEDCAGKDGEGIAITSITNSYTLSKTNTIDDAVKRAESLLSGFNQNSLPGPNTSGEVKVESGGQALLAWSPGASPSASRQTDRGAAVLSKSIIKLKEAAEYKIITYNEFGNVIGEQKLKGIKNQVITLDPPTSDGSKSFSLVAAGGQCSSIPVNSELSSTNKLTTKTLRVAPPPADGDDPEDQPCTTFFIAPDCKSYTKKTQVHHSDYYTYYYLDGAEEGDWEENTRHSKITTTTEYTACFMSTPKITTKNWHEEDRYRSRPGSSGDDKWIDTIQYTVKCADNVGEQTTIHTGRDSSKNTKITLPISNCPSLTIPAEGCSCGSDKWSSKTIGNPLPKDCIGLSSATTKTDSSCSSTNTSSEYEMTVQSDTITCTATTTQAITKKSGYFKTTYQNQVSTSFNEGDEETPANFDTKSWTEQDGLCAWKYTEGTMDESTADITIDLSLNQNPDKNYNVKTQMIIETNVTSNNCSYRYYDSYVESFTMKGDGFKQFGKNLTANNGETKCMIHHSAVAYEA